MSSRKSGAATEKRAARWSRLIEEQAASGLTQAEFCRRRKVGIWSFKYWKYERLPELRPSPPAGDELPALVAVELLPEEPSAPRSGVSLALGGRSLRVELSPGFDEETLRRAVEALGC